MRDTDIAPFQIDHASALKSTRRASAQVRSATIKCVTGSLHKKILLKKNHELG